MSYKGLINENMAVDQRIKSDGRGDVVKCAYMSWNLVPANTYGADFSVPPNGVDWGDVVKLAYYYWGLIPNL